MILDTMGWISTVFFSACALPEVIHAYKYKRCGLTWGLLIMWLLGEVFVLIPIAIQNPIPFLLVNYIANILFLIYLIRIKLRQPPVTRSTTIGASNKTHKGKNSINL
jgi:hypothetical protein